jgi:hypothetical protein
MMKQLTFILTFMAMLVMNTHGQTGGMIVSPGMTITQETSTDITFTNGNLLLQDDLNNSPSFLQKGIVTHYGTGDSKIEQYIVKDMWHMVSSPVPGEVNGAYMWMYLYDWIESTESWVFMNQPTNQPLVAGRGYFVWAVTNNDPYPTPEDVVTLNGYQFNWNTINDFALTYTASTTNPGWNQVGNPFPCAIDWNNHTDWDRTNVDASIYIYDLGSGGGSTGNYRVYNWNTGVGIPGGNDGIVAAGQGFWLHANGTGARIDIPASQRTHSTKAFYKNGDSDWADLMRLRLDETGSDYSHESVIAFSDGTSAGFDAMYDASYLEGKDEAPAIYTVSGEDNYTMNFLPSYIDYNEVPLNFYTGKDGQYTITATNLESFPMELPLWLEDKKENQFHDFRAQSNYNFTASLNDSPNRFIVHFGNPLGINSPNSTDMINIYAYEKTVYVNINGDNFNEGQCMVFDMMGKKVANGTVIQGNNLIPVPNGTGFYLVTVNSNRILVTDKLFIK